MMLMSANPNYRRALMNRDYAEITANLTLNRHFPRRLPPFRYPSMTVIRCFKSCLGREGEISTDYSCGAHLGVQQPLFNI
jgi:hypothetical protein